MKRFVAPLLAVLALSLPLSAQAQTTSPQAWATYLSAHTVWMRNTNAPTGSVVRQANWLIGSSGLIGQNPVGFADSSIFRRGAATRTAYDTTVAIATVNLPMPPIFGNGFPAALQDSVLPWFVLRVEQDSTNYGTLTAVPSGGSVAVDSIRVAVEKSLDGINWIAMAGTPTYRFDTVFLTSGADGTQSPTLVGVETLNSVDAWDIPFKCRASTINGVSDIVNLNACEFPYIRFIIGMATVGQFKVSVLTWANQDVLN